MNTPSATCEWSVKSVTPALEYHLAVMRRSGEAGFLPGNRGIVVNALNFQTLILSLIKVEVSLSSSLSLQPESTI